MFIMKFLLVLVALCALVAAEEEYPGEENFALGVGPDGRPLDETGEEEVGLGEREGEPKEEYPGEENLALGVGPDGRPIDEIEEEEEEKKEDVNPAEENYALGVGPDGRPLDETGEPSDEEQQIDDVQSDDVQSDDAKKGSFTKCAEARKKCREKESQNKCFQDFLKCVRDLQPTRTPLYTRNPRIQCLMDCVKVKISERRKCIAKCPPLRG